MTTPAVPVAAYTVTTTTQPVTVQAESFDVEPNGCIVFFSASSQTVAAFASGTWLQVDPVVAS